MAPIYPRRARSRGFSEPPRRPNLFVQLVLFAWFLVRVALAGTFTAAFAALGMLLWFGFTMPEAPADTSTKTDAVVVLTGGGERIERGYELLKSGLAARMYVTGAGIVVTKPQLLKRLGDPPAELAGRIEVGFRAADTRGNAEETAAWFNSQSLRSLRLVTANYHMRRSVLWFRRAMPDAEIIEHPLVPKGMAIRCDDKAAGCEQWWSRYETGLRVAKELVAYGAALLHITRRDMISEKPGK
jgi:uncharacterized SAM-binding protein YcdF (DUF218 family)